MYIINRPYRKNNPRSVRGARRSGWHVIEVSNAMLSQRQSSWMGMELWATKHLQHNFVGSWSLGQVAIESEADASMFVLTWT